MNQEKLDRVVTFLFDSHPELWDQQHWFDTRKDPDNYVWVENGEPTSHVRECGTTGCIAGWTCALEGEEFEWEKYIGIANRWHASMVQPYSTWIYRRASQILELDRDEEEYLFDPDRTEDDIRRFAESGGLDMRSELWEEEEYQEDFGEEEEVS